MTELSKSAAKLKGQIEKAFGDSKPPSILEHEGMFEDQERLDVMHALYRRKWQDIRCEALSPIADAVHAFLVPEAFCYYLPALMICSLDFFDSDLIVIALFLLTARMRSPCNLSSREIGSSPKSSARLSKRSWST